MREIDGVSRSALRGVGAECAARERGRRFQSLGWARASHADRGPSGVWEIFLPELGRGRDLQIRNSSREVGALLDLKADPYAFCGGTAAADGLGGVRLDRYAWNDAAWMRSARKREWLRAPISIYEVHLGSWRRDGDGRKTAG